MKKIYICGLAASGKGLMKQLLDGHSKLCMMPFQGFILKSLIPYDFVSSASKPRLTSPYRTEYFKHMPFFNIVIDGTDYKINFDEFIRSIYYNYDLNIISHSKRLWGEAGKGIEALVEFSFNYHQFEHDWFELLFEKQAHISIDEFLDTMYRCFFENWTNKYIDSGGIEGMFTTVQNGIAPIPWLLKNTNDSRLLLMERNGVGFSYALANKKAVSSRRNVLSEIYNPAVINVLKEYRQVIYGEAVKTNPRVLIVDFDKLVLDTRDTMLKVAEFLEIDYEDILTRATLNRIPLETGGIRFTGRINENPYESLPKSAIEFLEYLYYGSGADTSRWRQVYFFTRASKQEVSYMFSQWAQKFQKLRELVRGS